MNKRQVLEELILLENPKIKSQFSNYKITLELFLDTISKDSYTLSELPMSNAGITKLIKRVFPNKIPNKKVCNWLLQKYVYHHCMGCSTTLELNNINFYVSLSKCTGFSDYCKSCQNARNITQVSRTAKYKASKLQRTPPWANLDKIKEIYDNCPEGFHVDHVIPLQGKLVSGLHVENNLQYLTSTENLQKSNKIMPAWRNW